MCPDSVAADPVLAVLDTNIVLDVLVFDDPATRVLKAAVQRGQVRWLATSAMREELARVLAYPKIVQRLNLLQSQAHQVLAQFDALAQSVAAAPKAALTCTDADDQKFIDLALAHQATVISKDKAILCMAKRMQKLDARALTAIDLVA